MSINRYQDYLIVLFEDNAYKDIFLGFSFSKNKQILLKPVCQGFGDVFLQLSDKGSLILKELNMYHHAYVLACIDADLDSQNESKIEKLKKSLFTEYKERIFILGSRYEAEHIKRFIIQQGKWKKVGEMLENDCKNEHYQLWRNEMLQHNGNEIERFRKIFHSFLK